MRPSTRERRIILKRDLCKATLLDSKSKNMELEVSRLDPLQL